METAEYEKIKAKLAYIRQNKGFPLDVEKHSQYDEDLFIKSFINFCVYWKVILKDLEKAEDYETCKEIMDGILIQESYLNEMAILIPGIDYITIKLYLKEIKTEIMQRQDFDPTQNNFF